MKDNPLISIVTTFLNAEKYIAETIESVLGQTYTEWELLLVDDGSTDASTDIALDYARRQPHRVRYFDHQAHQNKGASASRNLGIREARGEYVAFLDADDIWLPEKLAEQIEVLRREPTAGMVYGATQYWYSWTGRLEDVGRDLLVQHGIEANRVIEPPALLIHYLLGETAVAGLSDILVRREVIEEVGGFEDHFRYIFTDQVFYGKLCLRTPVYVSTACWFRYRRHQESSVTLVKKRGQLQNARLTYLTWFEHYIAGQGLTGSEVWRAVKQAQWRCRHPNLARLAHHAIYRARVVEEVVKTIARQSLPGPFYRFMRDRWREWTEHIPESKTTGQK